MGARLSFKVAPKVRISATKSGLRLHAGPRGARIHVGGGRAGISTGAGPVSYYTSVGSRTSSSRRAAAPRKQQASLRTAQAQVQAAARREAAAAKSADRAAAERARLAEIEAVRRQMQQLVSYHHVVFAPAQRPAAPPIPPIPWTEIQQRHLAAATAGLGRFDRSARKEATTRAEVSARAEADALAVSWQRRRVEIQQLFDARWERLRAGDPEAVVEALEEAYADNAAAAVPVDVEERRAVVLVVVDGPDALPEKRPGTTSAGSPTLKAWNKTDAAEFYAAHVGSHVLATVREGFAVAPSLTAITTVVVRYEDGFGLGVWTRPEALYVGTFPRERWDRVDWAGLDPARALELADEVQIKRSGRAKELAALPAEGDIGTFLANLASATESADEDADHVAGLGTHTTNDAEGPQAPTGSWHPDPAGRFQYRWFDGSGWTQHVANGGERLVDPQILA